jgi:hypothetical protein
MDRISYKQKYLSLDKELISKKLKLLKTGRKIGLEMDIDTNIEFPPLSLEIVEATFVEEIVGEFEP